MKNQGRTLLEMLIVLSILGVLIALVVTVYSRFLDDKNFSAAVECALTLSERARSLTLASKDITVSGGGAAQYGIHFDDKTKPTPNRLLLFMGSNYFSVPTPATLESCQFPAGVVLDSVTIFANTGTSVCQQFPGAAEIYFDKITGGISALFTTPLFSICSTGSGNITSIVIKSTKLNKSKTIQFEPTGVMHVL